MPTTQTPATLYTAHHPTWSRAPPLPFRNLFEYDQVVNTQRDKIYADRRRAVLASGLGPLMIEYAEKTVDDILEVKGGWR